MLHRKVITKQHIGVTKSKTQTKFLNKQEKQTKKQNKTKHEKNVHIHSKELDRLFKTKNNKKDELPVKVLSSYDFLYSQKQTTLKKQNKKQKQLNR